MRMYKRYSGRRSVRSYRRPSTRGAKAHYVAKRTYRKAVRLPKRVLAKKYANTVGQIVYKSGRSRPSRGRRKRRGYRRY